MTATTQAALPPKGQRASYEVLQLIAFCAFPALLTLYVLYFGFRFNGLAPDFHQEFWLAARRVVDGLSPYDRGWMHINAGVSFPYPALTALVFVPFAFLPHLLADVLFVVLNIAAALLTLRVLDVRDRRVYGVMLLWPVVIEAWLTANLTLLLALGIAWMWRKRDHPLVAGVLVALLISLKPFVWPLGLWLIATRRYAAAGYAVVAGLAVNLIAWAILGFDQIHRYEQVTAAVTDAMYRRGYDLVALALGLGTSHAIASAIGVTVAVLAGLACLYRGRRGDELPALVLCVALILLATPVLWTHYFALMIVPVALASPRLSVLWCIPLLLWVCPMNPAPWQSVVALVVNGILILACLRRPGWGGERKRSKRGDDERGRDAGIIPALAINRREPAQQP